MDKAKEDSSLQQVEKMDMDNPIETYANIMADHKPDPRGPGYIKLYILSGLIFLCSTMNGKLY